MATFNMLDSENDDSSDNENKIAFVSDANNTEKAEELEFDPKAYKIFERLEYGSSCLTFDIIPIDRIISEGINQPPYDVYIVSGTQHDGKVVMSRISNINYLNDSSSEDEDESEQQISVRQIGFRNDSCINRIKRTTVNNCEIVAAWSESGHVNIWDITSHLCKLNSSTSLTKKEREGNLKYNPACTFAQHTNQGFALSWSNVVTGKLASGDCNGEIFIYGYDRPESFVKLSASSDSIEDIQWSQTEEFVLGACGSDGFISIWDCRQSSSKPLCKVKGSNTDVNVISWSKHGPSIISGDDNGCIKVWDIRMLGNSNCSPVSTYLHHHKAITSIEWHPSESTVFAASGEDDQITIYDINIVADDEKKYRVT